MKCNKCGHSNAPGTKFCRQCGEPLGSASPTVSTPGHGTRLEEDTLCVNCGAKVSAGKRFCTQCGAQAGPWIEPEFAELGLPPTCGLPAPPPATAVVAFYRTTLSFAYVQFKAGKLDDAIKRTTQLIGYEKLRRSPQYVMVLAAAYYVRGLAYEKKDNKAQASRDYQVAVKLLPNYQFPVRALERVKRG